MFKLMEIKKHGIKNSQYSSRAALYKYIILYIMHTVYTLISILGLTDIS